MPFGLDDWWTEDKLEVCFNEINDNVDLIYHNLEVVYKTKKLSRKIFKGRKLDKPVLNDLLLAELIMATLLHNHLLLYVKVCLKKLEELMKI